MNYFEMLENPWYQREETIEESILGVIVDGITDFKLFINRFQSLDNQLKIHQLSDTRSFILIKSGYKNLERLKTDFDCSHYQVYSIFLKDSYFDKFTDYLHQTNTDTFTFEKGLYYLFFEASNLSNKLTKVSHFLDFKRISNSPPQYFCGFKTFLDLLKSYFMLIKEGTNWPIFALPFKFIEKVNSQNLYNQIEFNQEITANSPNFNPDKNLCYMSFIKKEITKPQRVQNCEEMYSIREINDVQICHFFKGKIRTFLGFDNLFRCLHVYDYFMQHQNLNEFYDVNLIENSMTQSIAFNKVRYDLFYIENKSPLFDSSVLYSLNYVDFCDLNSSHFYGFDNINDFQYAYKILSNLKRIVINDVRIIETNEFNEKFDKKIAEKMLKTSFFYLVFSSQKSAINDLKTVFIRAKFIERNVDYKIDNKTYNKYALVGFETVDDRNNVFLALTKIQQSNGIHCFYPEDLDASEIQVKSTRRKRKRGRRNRRSKKDSTKELENSQREENDAENNEEYDINDDNNKHALVGFETVDDRNNAFLAPTKIQQSSEIQCFYPEDLDASEIQVKSTRRKRKRGRRNRRSKKDSTKEQENSQREENDAENNEEYDFNDKKDTNSNSKNKSDTNTENDDAFNDNDIDYDYDANENDVVDSNNDDGNEVVNDDTDIKYDDNSKDDEIDDFDSNENDAIDDDDDDDYDDNENDVIDDDDDGYDSIKQNQNKIENETNASFKQTTAINHQKNLESDSFSPNQSLIYLYFIEKEKARKISQGKQVKLTLFGVKKCKDIQRYKKLNDNKEENGYFTFFGFDNYEDAIAAISYIKSQWLSETTIKIYEHTRAIIQHNAKDNSEEVNNDKKQKKQQIKSINNTSNSNSDSSFKDLRIATYKALFGIHRFSYFYSQTSIPNNIQLELKTSLTKSKTVLNILKDVVSYNSSYEPFTYITVDSINPYNQSIFHNVLSRHKIGFSLMLYEPNNNFHYLEINERIIPISIRDEFLNFLEVINEIEQIERNVFHFGVIVTIIYFQPSDSNYIIRLIESFLKKYDCLFDYKKNSIKKAIHFNEEITLKRKEKDFELIVNEIKKIGLNPTKIERNKLLLTNIPFNNNILQQLSFICFNSIEDKLKALNHINSIVLKDKNSKIMKFNPALFYVQIDPFKLFPNNDQNALKKLNDLAKETKNVSDVQLNVSSIESTVDLAFIGFKSIKKFSFIYHMFLTRVSSSVLIPNGKIFNPDVDLFYLKFKTSKDVDLIKLINNEAVSNKIRDYQKNCSEISMDGKKVIIVNFIGFDNEQDMHFMYMNLKSPRYSNIVDVLSVRFDSIDNEITENDELESENLLTVYNMFAPPN